jgi:hypothetical protein
MKRSNAMAARILYWLTGVGVLVELLGLRLGLLNHFFFDTMHADVQGFDYFSLPKAWINLTLGYSEYDTFRAPLYGPHASWYLSHPAVAVWLGSWLSLFPPMVSYGVFTLLSLGMMAAIAWLLAREAEDALTRAVIWFVVLTAFPTYWMLYVGNVQALLVLALALVFVGMLRLARDRPHGAAYLLAGLLLSLLTKPVVLLMLPLLLLLRETRKATARALGIYVLVSVIFEVVPLFNPEAIGLSRVAYLAFHPQFVREHMNIYANHFQLTPEMKDNSIHWLNLVAQSGMRLMHVDVYSLPVFLDTLLHTRTPDWIYALPTLAVLVLMLLVARREPTRERLYLALLLLLAASLAFFTTYPTVWEYQYTSVLPVVAILLLVPRELFSSRALRLSAIVLALCAWLPSLYVLTEGHELTAGMLTLVRLDRVVPVTLLFVLLLAVVALALSSGRTDEVRS